MPETPYAATMRAVVGHLHPTLKEAGFRKRRHTFNRESEPGVVQVVNFQMGPYDVGDPVEIPGLRENLYGYFTVNLGVFLQEVHDRTTSYDAPKFISEYHCEIRKRLGELTGTDGDVWWSLEHDPGRLAADVGKALTNNGLPFLDRLSSRVEILQAWYSEGEGLGFPPRGELSVALIHWHRGEHELAARLLRDYLNKEHPRGHAEFARGIARSLGVLA